MIRATLEPFLPGQYILQALENQLITGSAGQKLRGIIEQSGQTLESLGRQGARAPVRWLLDVLDEPTMDGAACFAMRFGEQVRLTSHGGLSMLLMSSSNLREAISALRFLPLLTNSAAARFVESADGGGFLLVEPQTGNPVLDQLPLYYAASAVRRLTGILTGEQPAAIMHIAGPQPALMDTLPGFKPEQWRFGAATNCLEFDRIYLERPCLFADPVAFHATWRACAAELATLDHRQDLAQRVRQLLDERPEVADQQAIADCLHISCSTLKRQLAHSGTSFNQLLGESRKQLAIDHLLGGRLSVQQIAEKLGYSDQTNFAHAFKKWTGLAPGAFRRRLQDGA